MKSYIDFISEIVLGTLIKIIGIGLLLTVSFQVASRYLPIHVTWTDELARLLFVWFAMLSTAIAYIENKHLTIENLYAKCSPGVKNFLDYFILVLVLATSLVLSYKGIELLQIVAIQEAPILQIPMSWYYASLPVCFIFISIHTILDLMDRATCRTGSSKNSAV